MNYILTVLLVLLSVNIYGESFSIELENDFLYNTDRLYTHGTRLSYEHNEINYSLGQNMYTPSEISVITPTTNDRPYAGTLYFGINGTKYWEDSDIYHQLELNVGTVGKYSLCENTQKYIHDITGSQKPMGWDYQTDNMLLLQSSIRLHNEVYDSKYINSSVYLSGELGTIMAHTGAGANIMFGYNIPKTLNKPIVSKVSNFSLYMFLDGLGKNVLYNNLLDSDYTDITKESVVYELRSGIGVVYNGCELRYTACMRTEEFKEQIDDFKFGSILIKVHF